MYGGLGAQTAGLGGSGSAVRGRRCVLRSIAWGNWRGYAIEVLSLPDVPVQCRPIRVGEDGLGQGRGGGVHWVILRGLQLAGVWGWWQCRAWGAVRCGVVVSA